MNPGPSPANRVSTFDALLSLMAPTAEDRAADDAVLARAEAAGLAAVADPKPRLSLIQGGAE